MSRARTRHSTVENRKKMVKEKGREGRISVEEGAWAHQLSLEAGVEEEEEEEVEGKVR